VHTVIEPEKRVAARTRAAGRSAAPPPRRAAARRAAVAAMHAAPLDGGPGGDAAWPLAELRRRLAVRRPSAAAQDEGDGLAAAADGPQAEEQQQEQEDEAEREEARQEEERRRHERELARSDLVAFGGCPRVRAGGGRRQAPCSARRASPRPCPAPPRPEHAAPPSLSQAEPDRPELAAALFLQFARDAWGRAAPSAARAAADAARRAPEEELGLFVPPHPRVGRSGRGPGPGLGPPRVRAPSRLPGNVSRCRCLLTLLVAPAPHTPHAGLGPNCARCLAPR
jgi:hypothetical protein